MPGRVAVAENSRMWATAMHGALWRELGSEVEARVGRRAVAGDILSPLKALRSADEALGLIAAIGSGFLSVMEVERCSIRGVKNPPRNRLTREHGPTLSTHTRTIVTLTPAIPQLEFLFGS